jgi:hypothetical protein
MCGRVRLSSDYSEIKIRLKFAPDAPAGALGWSHNPGLMRETSVAAEALLMTISWT